MNEYSIEYLERVRGDIAALDPPAQKRVRAALEKKLTQSPEIFGKPLRSSLAGFRVLRVGDYRIVYVIKEEKVIIVFIGDRKHIYDEIKRLMG